MEKIKNLKIAVFVLILSILVGGCRFTDPTLIKEINNRNMYGLERINLKGSEVTITFNIDSIEYFYEKDKAGLHSFISYEENYTNPIKVMVTTKENRHIEIKDAEGKIRGDYFYLTFDIGDLEYDDLKSMSFNSYGINLQTYKLDYVLWGGDCSTTYSQCYRETSDTWQSVEDVFEVYEESMMPE